MSAHGLQVDLALATPAASARSFAARLDLVHLSGIELPEASRVRVAEQPARDSATRRQAAPREPEPPPRHHAALVPWQQTIRLVALVRGEPDPFGPGGATSAFSPDQWRQRHHARLAPWQQSLRLMAHCRGQPDPFPAPAGTAA